MSPQDVELLIRLYRMGLTAAEAWKILGERSAPAPMSAFRRMGKPLLWGSDLSAVRRARKVSRYSRASIRRR